MPAGMRPLDAGYDPEKDPEYEAALARYVADNPDSPDAGAARALDAPARPADVASIQVRRTPTPEPDRRAALALAIAKGEDLTPYVTQPAPDARVMPTAFEAPSPTPEGKALLSDLEAAGAAQKPAPPRSVEAQLLGGAGHAIASGAKGLAKMVARGVLRTRDQPERGAWYDSDPEPPPSAPPEPAAAPAPPPSPAIAGKLPPVPPSARPLSGRTAPERPLTEAQGQNIMAALRGPVRDITREASGLPPSGPPTPALVQPATAPPGPPAAPGVDPLQAAERAASQNRLIAGLARAGGTAIGRGNARGYDVLDANADVPMQELGAERADAERKKGAAALAMDQDPASPQSVMARELAAQVVPGIKTAAWYPSASYATLSRGPFAKLLDMNADLQKARIDAQAKVDAVRAKHAGGVGGVSEKNVQKLGAETQDTGKIIADLKTIRGFINRGGDIPGVGKWDSSSLKPDFMKSGDDITVEQAKMRIAGLMLHGQSGAAVTPSEAERFYAARGMGPGATEEQFKTGMAALEREVGETLKAQQAKYPKGTAETLASRGGVTAASMGGLGAPGAAAPAQSKTIGGKRYEQDPDGQWYEVDG